MYKKVDYIRRDEAINYAQWEGAYKVVMQLEEMKAADVQPVRRGRWIDIYEYCKMNDYIPSGLAVSYWCSECMKAEDKTSDFCPNCGADMRNKEE